MFGLKELPPRKLAIALATVSGALLVLASALFPSGSASMPTLIVWLVGILMLLGLWAMLVLEVGRRYFGGGGDSEMGSHRDQR